MLALYLIHELVEKMKNAPFVLSLNAGCSAQQL